MATKECVDVRSLGRRKADDLRGRCRDSSKVIRPSLMLRFERPRKEGIVVAAARAVVTGEELQLRRALLEESSAEIRISAGRTCACSFLAGDDGLLIALLE